MKNIAIIILTLFLFSCENEIEIETIEDVESEEINHTSVNGIKHELNMGYLTNPYWFHATNEYVFILSTSIKTICGPLYFYDIPDNVIKYMKGNYNGQNAMPDNIVVFTIESQNDFIIEDGIFQPFLETGPYKIKNGVYYLHDSSSLITDTFNGSIDILYFSEKFRHERSYDIDIKINGVTGNDEPFYLKFNNDYINFIEFTE